MGNSEWKRDVSGGRIMYIYSKMNRKTKHNLCRKQANNTLRVVLKARADKRRKVVGSRKMTKRQKQTFRNSYVKSCIKS